MVRWGPPGFWGSRGEDSLARVVSLSDFNAIYLLLVDEAPDLSVCTLCFLVTLCHIAAFNGPFSKLRI